MITPEKKKILFIEDDVYCAADALPFFKRRFCDIEFVWVKDLASAEKALETIPFCAIITDNSFPFSDHSQRMGYNQGSAVISAIRQGKRYPLQNKTMPILLQTTDKKDEVTLKPEDADMIAKLHEDLSINETGYVEFMNKHNLSTPGTFPRSASRQI